MKRTYEWQTGEGERIRANEIVGGSERFLIKSVRIWDDVQINDERYNEALSVSGGGATVWREFHLDTVWVWREQRL